MSEGVDLEVFRDVPGYKGILKAVLKSQIQLLLHQLAQLAGEETLLLSASVSDGTFGYLGSDFGKDFIRGNDEYKAKFLCFIMEKHHKKKSFGKPRTFADRVASHLQRSKGFHAARKFASSTPKSSSSNIGSKPQKRSASFLSEEAGEGESKRERTLDDSGTDTPNGRQSGVPSSEIQDYPKMLVKQECSDDPDAVIEPGESNKTGDEMDDYDQIQSSSFDYVLDQGRDDKDSPLPWELNGSERQPATSKRKQFLPTRHIQPGGTIDEETEAELFMKFAYGEDRNKENVTESVRKMSPASLSGSVAKVNLSWSNEGEYSVQGASLDDSIDAHGVKNESARYLEDNYESKYYKAPQLDGLLVSRGEGRYEKLIKCDICGKVCRTSNMARHKKRYCTGFPKGTPFRYRQGTQGIRHEASMVYEPMNPKLEFDTEDYFAASINVDTSSDQASINVDTSQVDVKEEPKLDLETDDLASTSSL